jgi:hypothetical protein
MCFINVFGCTIEADHYLGNFGVEKGGCGLLGEKLSIGENPGHTSKAVPSDSRQANQNFRVLQGLAVHALCDCARLYVPPTELVKDSVVKLLIHHLRWTAHAIHLRIALEKRAEGTPCVANVEGINSDFGRIAVSKTGVGV